MLVVALASAAVAQTPATPGFGATVSGVVRDSLAHHPLGGAIVQLVGVDPTDRFVRSANSDSLGRFTFTGVPDGRYIVGFLHPVLDSIGLEAPSREVSVTDGRSTRADLALPSARRLRSAICGTDIKNDSTGLVLGIVRRAETALPIEGATVVGQWSEFTLTTSGLTRTIPRLTATTASNGWFALCGVPSNATIALSSARDADSSSVIDVEVSADGFAHRDVYLGAARATVVIDSSVIRSAEDSARVDSTVAVPRLVRTGVGRLTGTVRRSPGDAPLSGAEVSIIEGPRTRADALGNWTIADAPLGTRMLEVRAVGYYPERKAVDVRAETPAIQSTLSTLKAVLDTVRVRATTLYARDRSGFLSRRRSGLGRYITRDDISRRNPLYVSDLLRMMPGLLLQSTGTFSHELKMRGTGVGFCSPTLYLDGMPMDGLTTSDLDAFVRPADITGIEVYSAVTVPPQFQRAFTGCGSIVVWTR